MIVRFKDSNTESIFHRVYVKGFSVDLQRRARRKLVMLNNSVDLKDLLIPPGNRLEKLAGDRDGQYSIRVNDQWRICFDWENGDAWNVELTDYH